MVFSIITPSFNQGQFLEETIQSVISQEGDFEIQYLVMDGGSQDNSVEILKKYEKLLKDNKRIKFYWQSKKDKGQVDAINQGLNRVTGNVVAYINSDDYYLPGAFRTIKEYFEKNPERMWVVGNCLVSDNKLDWTFWLKHIWPIDKHKQALMVFNTINQPAVFIEKELVKRVGKFDSQFHYSFDYDYWLRCATISLPIRINKPVSCFRIHQDSKGNTGFEKQFAEDLQIVRKYTNDKVILGIHKVAGEFVKLVYGFLK